VLYNEDVACHIRLAFAGLTFGAENAVSIINYRRGGSMSGANQLKCLQSHFVVMRNILRHPDAGPYRGDIAMKLWAVAGALAAYDDWDNARKAIAMAAEIGPPPPWTGGRVFRTLARLDPQLALRLREQWIRLAKPHLRSR
jgi:hypothetical protein